MVRPNMSDVIERYLKALLKDQSEIELRRAQLAEQFNCVPSQINYVIKTRFTPDRGYIVESKRGGGGFIRIVRVQIHTKSDLLDLMRAHLPQQLSEGDARQLISQLYDEQIISQQTGTVMLHGIAHQTLQLSNGRVEGQLRAQLMRAFLDGLRYER